MKSAFLAPRQAALQYFGKAGKRGFAFQTYLRCFVLQRLRLTKQVTKGILIVC